MKPIHKTTIEVVIFSRDPLVIPPEGDDMYDPILGWMQDCIEGDKIGDWNITGATTVEGDDLRAQLVSIGNGGSFFDDLVDDDDDGRA